MSGGTEQHILLVVEDDPGLQTPLKWAYDDYAVLIAGDHDAAMELLRAEEPAVVTLDLGLPPDPDGTREGFRLLRAILGTKPDLDRKRVVWGWSVSVGVDLCGRRII